MSSQSEPTTPGQSAIERLATAVQFLKGVGPRRVAPLERLGLNTVRDVLFFFPRDYQDVSDMRSLDHFEEGKLLSVQGEVADVDFHETGYRRSIVGVLLRCEGGQMRATWFNLPFMREKFKVGQRVLFSGKAKLDGMRWAMVHPQVQWLDDDEDAAEVTGRLLPIYRLTEGLTQANLRRIVTGVLDSYVEVLDEVFPPKFLEHHKLWPIHRALRQIHFPDDAESLAAARRRFVYQELFILQLAVAVRRRQLRDTGAAGQMVTTAQIDARICRRFPFELTPGQRQVIDEIAADMGRKWPMNRLLQGDVGSGKTVVAVYAMLLAVAHGYQAALMAPTEVLARQHYQTISKLLAQSQVRLDLLTAGVAGKDRDAVEGRIASGETDIIVGTHALLHGDIEFAKLGLVVIDEQHKFGVSQRASLKRAGADPHYLVMTATPIPRTVTMTLFGDLDVSTLHDHPPGKQTVYTYLAGESEQQAWWEFYGKKLREGRQGFVITPLVEESDDVAAASLDEMYETLANGPLEEFRLGLVYGRMSSAEKEAAMLDFRSGETQVLVATTVVEVGVDVPNATLMTIESGERFGLAQLHQLRGRIGRGRYPGFCCVFADARTDEASRRLEAFKGTTDGFRLAEIDLNIRGPGDLFGTRQHGLPPLKIADLLRDTELLEEARRDSIQFIEDDPGLSAPLHARLRRMVLARYGGVMDLGDVG